MKNKNEPSSLSYLGYLTKIKEKEYEIEYLKEQVELTINNYNSLVDKFNQSQSENKRLKAEIERLKDASNRLKQVIHDDVFDQLCHDCAESAVSVFEEIDELIKEVEEQ